MRVQNTNKQKAFIVNAEHVTKGGELTPDGKSIYINPGDTVEINDEVGQKLAEGYDNIVVVEKPSKKKA